MVNKSHGLSKHPLYQAWYQMIQRCENPADRQYPAYGGRGIRVCPAWHDLEAFVTWIEVNIGPRPERQTPAGRPAYQLDRIGNDGNYEPGNVRWATFRQQHHNTRTSEAVRERRRQVFGRWQQGQTRHQIADGMGEPYTTVCADVAWIEKRTAQLQVTLRRRKVASRTEAGIRPCDIATELGVTYRTVANDRQWLRAHQERGPDAVAPEPPPAEPAVEPAAAFLAEPEEDADAGPWPDWDAG
jgi:transposase-like protein